MANNEIDTSAQIRELQAQVEELRETLKDRGKQVAESMRDKANSAVDYTKSEAGKAMDLARENPTTTAASLLIVGLLGGMIGYAIGCSTTQTTRHRYWP